MALSRLLKAPFWLLASDQLLRHVIVKFLLQFCVREAFFLCRLVLKTSCYLRHLHGIPPIRRMPPSEYGDFPGALRGYRRQKNKARGPCSYRTAHGQAHSSSFLYLKTLTVIQGNPASAALEFTPTRSRTRTGFYLGNGEYPFPGVLPGLSVIRTRAFADIQVCCCYLYQEGTS